jgi:hypothetical protein
MNGNKLGVRLAHLNDVTQSVNTPRATAMLSSHVPPEHKMFLSKFSLHINNMLEDRKALKAQVLPPSTPLTP